MTRSEEELKIGKREVPAGQFRLRKWVETEMVSEEVELRRGHVSVERVPADRPLDAGTEIGDAEMTVNLTREEPVVEKTARVKEDISLAESDETGTERVTGEIRKERVDTDDKSNRA